MTEYVLVAAALAVTVAVVVSLAVISFMIHREDTCYTVTEPTSDRLARYVRLVTGVGVRNLGGASRMPPELVPMAGRDVIPP